MIKDYFSSKAPLPPYCLATVTTPVMSADIEGSSGTDIPRYPHRLWYRWIYGRRDLAAVREGSRHGEYCFTRKLVI